jgi:uncharacterized lipoprotein YddW (UPF0748 family)
MKSLVIEVVKKYDVDGIQGDDRLPAMPVKGGYDDYTVALYKSENGGASPPTNENNTAWIDWRTNKLTEFQGDLYRAVKAEKPNVIVSCSPSVSPWAKANYLQDWPTWLDKKYCDYVIPQIYRYDFASYQSTLKSQVAALKNSADKSKLYAGVLIQFGTYNSTNLYLEQMVNENRVNGISGEIFFFYEGLKFNSEYFTTKYPLSDLTISQPTAPPTLALYQVATPVVDEFYVIVYPNPSSDVFTLEVQSFEKGNAAIGVQVYDMTGRLIKQCQVKSNTIKLGENYPPGVYNVIVNQGEKTKTFRLIKS